MSDNIADRFQEFVAGILESDSYFADIHLFQERSGTAAAQVDKATAGQLPKADKFGAWCVIEMPERRPVAGADAGCYELALNVVSSTIPKINNGAKGTGKSVGAIAERVEALLAQLPIGPVWKFSVRASEPFSFADGTVGYTTEIKWNIKTRTAARTAQPDADGADSLVTLTCETASAVIRYSVDGTFPSLIYTAPFAITGTGDLYATAIAPGRLISGIMHRPFRNSILSHPDGSVVTHPGGATALNPS